MRSATLIAGLELSSIWPTVSSAPKMTARSSSVSAAARRAGKPDFCTRPPSSMRRRVRARRSCIQARVSVRTRAASARRSAAVVRRSAVVVACSSRWSVARAVRLGAVFAAKEAVAFPPPRLLRAWISFGALDRFEQRARECLGIERVGAGCGNQFAELSHTASAELLLLVLERLQFGVDVARLAHGSWVLRLQISWGG